MSSHNARRKNEAELGWWVRHIAEKAGTPQSDWRRSLLELANSVPDYRNHLRLDDYQCGRLLEIGCGPKVPARHLVHTEVWGIDPMLSYYMAIGFPLLNYGAVLLPCVGEDMWSIPNNWFDTVVSVNALDHCDNFQQVAAEIERVVKPDGLIRLSIPYHEPTPTEPLKLDDETVLAAFSQPMRRLDHGERSRPGMMEALWTND